MKSLLTLTLLCFSILHAQEKILDTHIHLYDTEREGSFDFLDDAASAGSDILRYPHLAQTFLDTASPSGVEYAYVVEASLRREDNFWLSLITDTSDCLLGFSANLDPRASTYHADLDSLLINPKFRGIRPRIGGLDLGDMAVRKQFVELARRGLALELWGNSNDIAAIARMYPNMNIIVNHFAGGSIRKGILRPADYSSRMAMIAAEPNVYLKISALYSLSGSQPAPLDMNYYKPLIDLALDAFGPERVMYGSNWSLSGLRGPYRGMPALLRDYCDQREDLSRDQLFYDNAMKAYGLLGEEVEHPGTGNGLFVSYWNGNAGGRGWWEDSICGSYIPAMDAYWEASPAEGVNPDFWNARFSGQLEAMVSGNHRIFVTINDYVRLWINGELVIDAWGGEYSRLCHTASVDLVAGQPVDIRLDYANTTGDGFVRLEWEAENLSRELIPECQFYNDVDTSSTTSIGPSRESNWDIRIYPNPVQGELCIQCPVTGVCEIFTQDGKKVEEFRVSEGLTRRDTSEWTSGIYLVRIHTGSMEYTHRIVVA